MTGPADLETGKANDPKPIDYQVRIFSIVFTYATFAGLWILLSDKAVAWLTSDPQLISLFGTIKGLLFVLVTSLLLLALMKRLLVSGTLTTPIPPAHFRLTLPLILIATAIFTLTASAIFYRFSDLRDKETLRLQAIATLKTQQIADWLETKLKYAEFLQISPLFGVGYDIHNRTALDTLETRLEQFRVKEDFAAILLLDSHAEPLKTAAAAHADLPPALRDTAGQALADRQIHLYGPYLDQNDRLKLDFIVPLTTTDGGAFLVVLQTGSKQWLSKTLQSWPEPYSSGEMLLFQNTGGQIQWLFEPGQHHNETAKSISASLNQALLSLPKPDGNTETTRLIQDEDYRGVAFYAWVQSIPGTGWLLLAKKDRSEFYVEAVLNSVLIAITGLLALLMTAAGFFLLHQRQQLNLATTIQQTQEKNLRALGLLAAIAESSDDAIFAKDLQGRYTLFNPAACRYAGKPAEQVLGEDDCSLFPRQQAELLISLDKKIISENRIHSQEEVLDTAQGERVFMATKGPLRDTDGCVIGIFGISRDITERKQAELALQTTELSYRNLFENMLNGCAYCRILLENGQANDFIYLEVNKAFETLTGLRDVVGRRVSEVLPGIHETDPGLFETYARVAMNGHTEHFELYVHALQMWFLVSVYSPQVEHFVAVFDVITERKLAELQLQASEERLKLALEATNDGLWDWDLRTGLAYLTPRYYELTSYRAEEVIANFDFFKRTVHPDDLQEVLKIIDATLQDKIPVCELDYRMLTPAGEIKWIKSRGKVVERDAAGQALRMVGTITDISIHKAAEVAIRRQTEELAKRNTELERFNRAAVGRELDMIALKKQVNALSAELGREPVYSLAFLDEPTGRNGI